MISTKHLSVGKIAMFLFLAGCSADRLPTDIKPSFAAGAGDPTATWKLPLADAGLAFTSDYRQSDGTYSVYANGVCNVAAQIYVGGTGDATISTDAATRKTSCTRAFTLRYPDGFTETVQAFNNLRNLQTNASIIPVGATSKRLLILNPGARVANSRCGRILFGVGDNPVNGAGSDSLLVTRLDARTWQVRSDPAHNLAWCQNTGELFAMNVDFRVEASRDMPY